MSDVASKQQSPNLPKFKKKFFFTFTMKQQYKESKFKILIFSHDFKLNWAIRGHKMKQ